MNKIIKLKATNGKKKTKFNFKKNWILKDKLKKRIKKSDFKRNLGHPDKQNFFLKKWTTSKDIIRKENNINSYKFFKPVILGTD